MLRQILDAEIMYFLDNSAFFPLNKTYIVTHSGASAPGGARAEILEFLNVDVPVGHLLDFTITGISITALDLQTCIVTYHLPRTPFPSLQMATPSSGEGWIRRVRLIYSRIVVRLRNSTTYSNHRSSGSDRYYACPPITHQHASY